MIANKLSPDRSENPFYLVFRTR